MISRSGDGMLSVVVADPHPAQRDRIRTLVDREPDLHVVAVACRREDAAQLLWELDPDAAVIEVGLLSACEYPLHGWGLVPGHVRLIGVGLAEDPWLASALAASGFAAYLPEARLAGELCDALRGPHAGRAGGPARRFRRMPVTTATVRAPARFERTGVGAPPA